MKIVAALDSFKGCLTSLQAGEAVRQGILRAMPDAEVRQNHHFRIGQFFL